MKCISCKNNITKDAKFCVYCGEKCSGSISEEPGSVDKYFEKQYHSCNLCGSVEPLVSVEYYQNWGYIVARQYKHISGLLCKACSKKTFFKFTITTLLVGWLGVVSFFIAPLYIINNVYYFIKTLIKLR